jgi:hypothetical protein
METDSIPDETQGDLEDHSLINDSADTTDADQSSNEEDSFFSNEEDETEDDAPSQTQETIDDTEDDEEPQGEDDRVDPELAKWANSQNISLETDTEIKLAKRLRDTQKGFHEKTAEAKAKFQEATDEVTNGDIVSADSAKLARMEFFMDNPDAKQLEGAMYDIALQARDSGDKAGFMYFQTPAGWKTLLQIAKANQAEVQSEDSYSAGRTDERKNLAKKQQAKATTRAAQSSAPESTKITDEKINNMSLAEYNKFRAENPSWNPFR